jgi:hypothetical protein
MVTLVAGSDLSGTLQGAGGIGGLLAISQLTLITPEHAYHHADGNGNVTMLINTQQLAVAKYVYEPFGALASIAGPWAELNRFRFSSKEDHANSALVLYEARAYEPLLSRVDPLGFAWYDDLANSAGHNINAAQDAFANHLGYFSVPINNTLSFINMAAQSPSLILNIGTATGTTGSYLDEPILQPLVTLGAGLGTWWENPTWENAAAAAADISTAFSLAAAGFKPLPSFRPKRCPSGRQPETPDQQCSDSEFHR